MKRRSKEEKGSVVVLLCRSGPTVRWRTMSRVTRERSSLTIALTFEGSVSSLTLKRTMCSTTWVVVFDDDVVLIEHRV